MRWYAGFHVGVSFLVRFHKMGMLDYYLYHAACAATLDQSLATRKKPIVRPVLHISIDPI